MPLHRSSSNVTITDGTISGTNLSNANMCRNSNGANPVNQRGVADTDALSTGDYSFDGWYVTHDCTSVQVDLVASTSSGVNIVTAGAGTSTEFAMKIEDFAEYQGKSVTLTMGVVSNNACTIFWDDGAGTTNSTAHTGGGSVEELTVTRTIDGSATKLEFGIDLVVADSNYARFTYCKPEEGSVATPWTVPDPAEELARCQRYYQEFCTGSANCMVGIGQASTTSIARCHIPNAVTMRTTPSVSYSDLSHFQLLSGAVGATPTTIGAITNGDSTNGVGVQFNDSGASLTAGYSVEIRAVSTSARLWADAEL